MNVQAAAFPQSAFRRIRSALKRTDRVALTLAALLAVIALATPGQADKAILFTLESLLQISPFLALSVLVAAYAAATGADGLIAKAFEGNPARMIVIAAIFGALSPFCSCGVIPLIAGLLAAGVPIAPVMAFWIASPLMDPEMFILSAATLGLPFTIAKTLAAVAMGLMAGFVTQAITGAGLFADPLRAASSAGCGGGCGTKNTTDVAWRFWRAPERRATFLTSSRDTGLFLGKWLALAFVIESQMIAHVPADLIVSYLGAAEWWTMPAAVVAGVPAYLNGYAAIPLMARLIEMGMAPGPALAFLLAGSVTSIPAAVAVWVLVKPKVFGLYVAIAASGSLLSGVAYQIYAG